MLLHRRLVDKSLLQSLHNIPLFCTSTYFTQPPILHVGLPNHMHIVMFWNQSVKDNEDDIDRRNVMGLFDENDARISNPNIFILLILFPSDMKLIRHYVQKILAPPVYSKAHFFIFKNCFQPHTCSNYPQLLETKE